MKLLHPLVSAACLTGFAAIACAATPLVNVVTEQAPIVFSVQDVPGLMKNWEKGPLMATWGDSQMQKFLEPLRQNSDFAEFEEKFKAETGLTPSEIVDLIQGDALIAVTNLNFSVGDKAPPDFPILIAVEVRDNAEKVEKILLDQQAKHTENSSYTTEDFAGSTIHGRTSTEEGAEKFFWTVSDGVFAFSPSKTELLTLVDALKKGGVDNAFGKGVRFASMSKDGATTQVRFVMNFTTIIPWAQQQIAEKTAGQQPNAFFNPATIIPALGLDAWRDAYWGIDFADAQAAISGGLTYSEARGLTKMMAYREGLPKALPPVPVSSLTATAAHFSIRDMYAALEEMIGAYNPGVLGMGQMYLQQFNQQLGIDIKRDLIGSIGAEFVSGYSRRPGSTGAVSVEQLDQYFAVSLDNAKTFNTAIDALLKSAGPSVEKMIQKRDYLGYSLNTIPTPGDPDQPGKSVSYVVAKNYFMISLGSPAAIESALQTLAGKQPAYWERKEVKQALSQLPANACTFSYQDTAAMLSAVCRTMADLAQKTQAARANAEEGEGTAKKETVPLDPTAAPDAATLAKYWSDSSGYGFRDQNGFYFKSVLPYKK